MSVDAAVRETIEREPELARAVAAGEPKAWGRLAARGVLTFREVAGRAPSEAERRAIWAGLWAAARRPDPRPRRESDPG